MNMSRQTIRAADEFACLVGPDVGVGCHAECSAKAMPVSLEPFGGMMRFSIASEFDTVCVITSESIAGEVYHVEQIEAGGENFTPVARFFAWRPVHVENFHPHWRV